MSEGKGYKKSRTNSTAGRTVYSRQVLKIFGMRFEWLSDLISFDYMRRWQIRTPWGCARLHHILRSDNDRHFHDHPMSFASLILWGGYIEHTPSRDPRVCRAGSMVFRRAEDPHFLKLRGKSAWTFLLTGPFRRDWGFHTEDGWIIARDYDAYLEKKRQQAGAPYRAMAIVGGGS